MSTQSKVESLIHESNLNGNTVFENIGEVPNFPFEDFSNLVKGIKSRQASLRRHSLLIEATIFYAVANRNEKLFYVVGQILLWGAIPFGLTLGILVSWWLLIVATLVYLFGKKIVSDTYDKSIFRSAMGSERIFCFLYHHNQISVGLTLDKSIHYYKGT